MPGPWRRLPRQLPEDLPARQVYLKWYAQGVLARVDLAEEEAHRATGCLLSWGHIGRCLPQPA